MDDSDGRNPVFNPKSISRDRKKKNKKHFENNFSGRKKRRNIQGQENFESTKVLT